MESERKLVVGHDRRVVDDRGRDADGSWASVSAPGRNRTCDPALRRGVLYPLSYRGTETNDTYTMSELGRVWCQFSRPPIGLYNRAGSELKSCSLERNPLVRRGRLLYPLSYRGVSEWYRIDASPRPCAS